MQTKEQMRLTFEESLRKKGACSYSESEFDMWCDGYAEGFLEGVFVREMPSDGGNQGHSLVPERVTDVLTNRKADDIATRDGYKFSGYVLTNEDLKKCIVDRAAVRWMESEDFWDLMHPIQTFGGIHD